MVSESCELDIIHLAGEDCAIIPVVARHFQQGVANLAISEFVTRLGKCLANCDLRNKKKLSIIRVIQVRYTRYIDEKPERAILVSH